MTYIRRKLKAEKRNHGHYGDANDGSKKNQKIPKIYLEMVNKWRYISL